MPQVQRRKKEMKTAGSLWRRCPVLPFVVVNKLLPVSVTVSVVRWNICKAASGQRGAAVRVDNSLGCDTLTLIKWFILIHLLAVGARHSLESSTVRCYWFLGDCVLWGGKSESNQIRPFSLRHEKHSFLSAASLQRLTVCKSPEVNGIHYL